MAGQPMFFERAAKMVETVPVLGRSAGVVRIIGRLVSSPYLVQEREAEEHKRQQRSMDELRTLAAESPLIRGLISTSIVEDVARKNIEPAHPDS